MENILFFGVVLVFFAIVGIWLLLGYFFIRFIASKEYMNRHFGLFFTGTMMALAGYWLSELGYQMNFWEAPGVWDAPGKESTIWYIMQYVLVPLGFISGILMDRMLERTYGERTWSIRIKLAVLIGVLIIATIGLLTHNSLETMG